VVSSVTPRISEGGLGPLLRAVGESAAEQVQDVPVLLAVLGDVAGTGTGLLELDALVDQEGGVTAVVQDHVGAAGRVFGQVRACSVHHQYSSRLSPFQAKTGTPWGLSGVPLGADRDGRAAWSWVEKMLQDPAD